MYLKYTISGPLEELVKRAWPRTSEDELLRDYENVYEWVWLTLPKLGIRLNISREHEWGEGAKVFPIYVSAFGIEEDEFVDEIPENVIQKIHNTYGCRIEIHAGTPNADEPDGTPIKVVE